MTPLLGVLLCATAGASDDAPEDPEVEAPEVEEPEDDLDGFAPAPPTEDALPQALAARDRVVPNTSFEFALQYSFGPVVTLYEELPPGAGAGLRGSWGKHLGLHRVGVSATLLVEGQLGQANLFATEVLGTWDHVGPAGLLVGAGLGGLLGVVAIHDGDDRPLLVPSVTARVGGSQTWSRYQRRLFVFVEGKVRAADGYVVPVVAICVGAGKGAGEYRPN